VSRAAPAVLAFVTRWTRPCESPMKIWLVSQSRYGDDSVLVTPVKVS
jgi:hypothetical protein